MGTREQVPTRDLPGGVCAFRKVRAKLAIARMALGKVERELAEVQKETAEMLRVAGEAHGTADNEAAEAVELASTYEHERAVE